MTSDRLAVLTWNVGLLHLRRLGRTLAEVPHLDARFPHVVQALRDTSADIVLLQEVFEQRHREQLVDALRDRLPFAAAHDAPRFRSHSGLLALSRVPLIDPRFVPFRAAPLVERLLVQRGLVAVDVDPPGFPRLTIANLHTTSGGTSGTESDSAEALRDQQLSQAQAVVAARAPLGLLCGDFNAGPQASSANYEGLLQRGWADAWRAAPGGAADAGITWDPANLLNAGGPFGSSPPQRIDHVLLNRQAQEALRVTDARIVLTEPTVSVAGGRVTRSDHYGLLVELSR